MKADGGWQPISFAEYLRSLWAWERRWAMTQTLMDEHRTLITWTDGDNQPVIRHWCWPGCVERPCVYEKWETR